MTSTQSHLRFGVLALAGVALIGLGGCRGERSEAPPRQIFPDMDDSPKWKPQTASGFYTDGRSMRPRVEGTVAFGLWSNAGPSLPAWVNSARDELLKDDVSVYKGTDAKGAYISTIPASIKLDLAMIERGQARYNIYCAACHGYAGDGLGTAGVKWSYAVPNFHDAKYFDLKIDQGKDGYIFHTIRNGVPGAPDGGLKMPAYGEKVDERDAWAIVAWVRTLQETRRGSLDLLPEAQRAEVKKMMDEAKAAAEKAGTAMPAGGTK